MKKIKNNTVICLIVLCVNLSLVTMEEKSVDDLTEEILDFAGIAEKCGYDAESYDIITEDGYILKLFHIPGNVSRPVFLSHGLIQTADTFILREERSLPIILAKGYDVWVGCYRGVTHSRRHVTLDPDVDKKFWDFSFHEMAAYDAPAMIDFIYEKNGYQPISVIGHSEGSTVFFALTAMKPEYNEKIKLLIALSPVCFLEFLYGPLQLITKGGPVLSPIIENLGMEELLSRYSPSTEFVDIVCNYGKLTYTVCNDGVFSALFGYNPDQLGEDFFSVVTKYFPAGTSRKNLFHLAQSGHTNMFTHNDYGLVKNLQIYGSAVPPGYDLRNIVTNVALIYSLNDRLATPIDVLRLRDELPNVVDFYQLESVTFNHMDFVFGRDADVIVYSHVVSLLDKYNY